MKDQLQGVKMIPSRRNPNLERLVALQPDLMVGTFGPYRNVYPQLSQIAPTVVIKRLQPWQDNLRLVAQTVDKLDEAETWLSACEQRLIGLADIALAI